MTAKFPPSAIRRMGALNTTLMLTYLQRCITDTGTKATLFSHTISFPAGFWIIELVMNPLESLTFRSDPSLMALVIDQGGTP